MNYLARIVCIDDEPAIIELVNMIFIPENIQVDSAYNGEDGLALIRRDPPDAVILDIMMPGMDGWEVYRRIRADKTLKNVPVIILTARNSSFEEIIARERAGVDDYVVKPFIPSDLRKSLAKVLGSHYQLR